MSREQAIVEGVIARLFDQLSDVEVETLRRLVAEQRALGSRSSGRWPCVFETRALSIPPDARAEFDDETPTAKVSR